MISIKTKKGIGFEFIITASLLLISFFLVAVLLAKYGAKTNDLEAELLCQTSIAQRARTALNIDWEAGEDGVTLFKSQVKTIPPLCRTVDKKISGTKEQLLRQVADNAARCWWMFGEGRYEELLDNVDADVFPAIFGFDEVGFSPSPEQANQCFNCYTLLVDQNEISGGAITQEELTQYLTNHTYAKVNRTYLDYFQGYGGPGRVVLTMPEMLPNHAYTISMMPKNKKESTFWKGVIQQAAGTLLAGSGLGFPLIYIGQQNQLADAFKERDVSSIYISTLEEAQLRCGEGDIVGQ